MCKIRDEKLFKSFNPTPDELAEGEAFLASEEGQRWLFGRWYTEKVSLKELKRYCSIGNDE